jgi:hypothetical protein
MYVCICASAPCAGPVLYQYTVAHQQCLKQNAKEIPPSLYTEQTSLQLVRTCTAKHQQSIDTLLIAVAATATVTVALVLLIVALLPSAVSQCACWRAQQPLKRADPVTNMPQITFQSSAS